MAPETLYYFSKYWLKRKVAQVLVTESLNLKDHDPAYLKMSQNFLSTEDAEQKGATPEQIKDHWLRNQSTESNRYRAHIMNGIFASIESLAERELNFEEKKQLEHDLHPLFDDESMFHTIPQIARQLTIDILRK